MQHPRQQYPVLHYLCLSVTRATPSPTVSCFALSVFVSYPCNHLTINIPFCIICVCNLPVQPPRQQYPVLHYLCLSVTRATPSPTVSRFALSVFVSYPCNPLANSIPFCIICVCPLPVQPPRQKYPVLHYLCLSVTRATPSPTVSRFALSVFVRYPCNHLAKSIPFWIICVCQLPVQSPHQQYPVYSSIPCIVFNIFDMF